MIALFFDTATKYGVVGIFQAGKLLLKKEFPAAFTNSKLLLPAIHALLEELSFTVQDLSYIAVGVGPGSYTGIRVAVALAKGLSFSLHIPLVAISSLRGIVPEPHLDGLFIGAIDAKIGGVYAICGHVTSGKIYFDGNEELLSIPDFALKLAKVNFLITLEGEGVILQSRVPTIKIDFIECIPSLHQFGLLSYAAFCEGKGVLDGNLPLLYLRQTQAEINIGQLPPLS